MSNSSGSRQSSLSATLSVLHSISGVSSNSSSITQKYEELIDENLMLKEENADLKRQLEVLNESLKLMEAEFTFQRTQYEEEIKRLREHAVPTLIETTKIQTESQSPPSAPEVSVAKPIINDGQMAHFEEEIQILYDLLKIKPDDLNGPLENLRKAALELVTLRNESMQQAMLLEDKASKIESLTIENRNLKALNSQLNQAFEQEPMTSHQSIQLVAEPDERNIIRIALSRTLSEGMTSLYKQLLSKDQMHTVRGLTLTVIFLNRWRRFTKDPTIGYDISSLSLLASSNFPSISSLLPNKNPQPQIEPEVIYQTDDPRVAVLEERLEELQCELALLVPEDLYTEAQEEIQQLKLHIQTMNDKHQTTKRKVDEMQDEITQLKRALRTTTAKLEKTTSALTSLRKDYTQKEDSIDLLSAKVKHQGRQVLALERQLLSPLSH